MLICVDFQPSYHDAFASILSPLRRRLRKALRKGEEVHFLYNETFSLEGEELGDPVERILAWGERERLPLTRARMIRKNFGWVSHAVRSGDERKVAVALLRHLLDNGLSHSAEVSEENLRRIISVACGDFEAFQQSSPSAWDEIKVGAIALPLVFDGGVHSWLASHKREEVEMIGGFRHRCFDEICMLLEAGGISYHLNEELIYSLPDELAEIAWEPLEKGKGTTISPLLLGNPCLS